MTFRTMQWQSLGQSLRVRAAMSLSSVCLLLPNSSDGSPRPRRRAAAHYRQSSPPPPPRLIFMQHPLFVVPFFYVAGEGGKEGADRQKA